MDLLDGEERYVYDEEAGEQAFPELVEQRERTAPRSFPYASYDPADPLNWYLRAEHRPRREKRRLLEDPEWLDATLKRIRQSSQQTDAVVDPSPGNGGSMELCPTERIFTVPPRYGDWLPVTLPDYRRMYVVYESAGGTPVRGKVDAGRQLLGRPFVDLLLDAESINATRQEQTNDDNGDRAIQSNQSGPWSIVPDSQLWSSKYQPRAYIDLLSDEGANRALLTWLRLWDRFVFNRRPKVAAARDLTGFVVGKQPAQDAGLDRSLDGQGRPVVKIALLTGAPGVGKTTLAYVAARLCGYQPVELNASDDRSLEAFQSLLKGALQIKRTLDAAGKPHCAIIDEIDGAPLASVNYLASLSRTRRGLRRPVICICNDLYAPALRQLRQVALVLSVPSVETRRLSERLLQICLWEALNTEVRVMDALCRKADNDIRCCVNTLQFLKSSQRSVCLEDVLRIEVGQKDERKSLFDVWKAVFTNSRRASSVLSVLSGCGEDEVLMDGLFETYPHVQFKDKYLSAVRTGLGWVTFADRLSRCAHQWQQYQLLAYGRYAFVAFSALFGGKAGTAAVPFGSLKYPSQGKAAKQRLERNKSILASLWLQQHWRLAIDRQDLLTDVVPFLLRIVHPEIKSANPQLYGQQEMVAYRRCVSVMAEYNLTYRQQRMADGKVETVIEPPLDEIALFPLEQPLWRRTLSASLKLAIAREVQLLTLSKGDRQREAQRPPAKDSREGRSALGCRPFAEKPTVVKRSSRPFVVEFKYQEGCDSVIKRRIGVKHLM